MDKVGYLKGDFLAPFTKSSSKIKKDKADLKTETVMLIFLIFKYILQNIHKTVCILRLLCTQGMDKFFLQKYCTQINENNLENLNYFLFNISLNMFIDLQLS